MSDASILRLVRAYDAAFREQMSASPEEVADAVSCLRAARALPAPLQDLLDTLLLAGGAGQSVDPRFRPRIEAEGEALWNTGLLIPETAPTSGATIDPRYYAAACRLNPGLRRRRPLRGSLPRPEQDPVAQFPPADARWDAVVISAALEASPPNLNKDGSPRKDMLRRLLEGVGPDTARWTLALDLARALGLARPASGRLYGFPESRPRALVEPLEVLPAALRDAGRVLLRLIDDDWVDLRALMELLRLRARDALHSANHEGNYNSKGGVRFSDESWPLVEAPALTSAADLLHRIGVIDAARDAEGVVAARRAQGRPQMPPGFMLTPDLDILVGAGELPSAEYGRLARLAPYSDGDRVHRHKLTREGVAADIVAGHDDAEDFLARYSRTGMPSTVRQAIDHWTRSAERLTIFTGVHLIEDAQGLRRLESEPPDTLRVIDYTEESPPAAGFTVNDGELHVLAGSDALNVRAAVGRIGRLIERDAAGWRYALDPQPTSSVEALLETLRRLYDGPELPGELEALVLASSGVPDCKIEEAVVLHLPERAAAALRRDRVAGSMLSRPLNDTQCMVSRADLPALRARFAELGIGVGTLGEG